MRGGLSKDLREIKELAKCFSRGKHPRLDEDVPGISDQYRGPCGC
jgi:hypothetical protein